MLVANLKILWYVEKFKQAPELSRSRTGWLFCQIDASNLPSCAVPFDARGCFACFLARIDKWIWTRQIHPHRIGHVRRRLTHISQSLINIQPRSVLPSQMNTHFQIRRLVFFSKQLTPKCDLKTKEVEYRRKLTFDKWQGSIFIRPYTPDNHASLPNGRS